MPLQRCQEGSAPHCVGCILHHHMGSEKIQMIHWVGNSHVGLDSRNAKTFRRYHRHDLWTKGLIHHRPLETLLVSASRLQSLPPIDATSFLVAAVHTTCWKTLRCPYVCLPDRILEDPLLMDKILPPVGAHASLLFANGGSVGAGGPKSQ